MTAPTIGRQVYSCADRGVAADVDHGTPGFLAPLFRCVVHTWPSTPTLQNLLNVSGTAPRPGLISIVRQTSRLSRLMAAGALFSICRSVYIEAF
jgi:hypothetical protein